MALPINQFLSAKTLLELPKQLGIAAIYLFFGYLVQHYFTSQGIVSAIWPGSGLALAALLIGGKRYLWGIVLGALLVNTQLNNSPVWVIGATLASILEALLGYWLLTRNDNCSSSVNNLSDYLQLLVLGGGIAGILGAIIGASALLLAGFISPADFFVNASRWWMGDTLGVVLVTPFLLAWRQTTLTRCTGKQLLEGLTLLGITFITGQIVFLDWFSENIMIAPKAFVMFLFIIWIAIRIGIRCTTFALNMIAIQALSGAYLKIGYFADELDGADLYNYWFYMLILSGVGMAMATYVNEIKQKQLSLKESESRLRLSQIKGGIGTWEADLVHNKQAWSENCISLLGFPALSEPTWEDFMMAIHPDDRQRVIDAIQSHIDRDAKYEVEYRIEVNQEIRWMRSAGEVERDQDGKPIIIRGIAQDITERKQSEELLRESEQHFRTLANGGVTLIWASGADKLCNYFNQPWLQFTGRTFDQELDNGWTEGVHPDDVESCLQAYASAFDKREPFSLEYRLRHVDGSYHWIRDDGNPRYDSKGNFIGYIGFCYDITPHKKNEERLQQSEEKLRAYLNNISDTIWLIDSKLNIAYVSPNVSRMLGFLPEELIGQPSAFIIHPNDMGIITTAHRYVMKHGGEAHTIQYRVSHKDKRWIYVETTGINMLGNPEINGVLVSMRNITERKQAEMDLRIAATAFESQEGMFITDASRVILRVNRAFTSITGYSGEEVIGKSPNVLQSGLQNADFYAAMWESIHRTGAWAGEIWNQRKNGENYPEHLTITEVKDPNGIVTNYVATLTDLTINKAAAHEIERLAFYDCLTGLPNRQLLRDRLVTALAASNRSGRQGALLFIDMDNFKTLNDTLGHDMGDLLLQQVAQRLVLCVREGDTVARLGGDEFVVVLEDLSEHALESASQTEVISHKIMASLSQPYLLAMQDYRSTASIGATLFKGHEQSIDELLKQADIAMYQAKTSGRNALRFFDPQMQASITNRVRLEADLRLALADNQFKLYYQPQITRNRRVIGAEVLIRWQHPLRGLVSPADFIPLAEETDLICAIGQWVLETACNQIKLWEGNVHSQHLQLSVNVSARQFHQADFVEQVRQVLRRTAINPDRLNLELTESLVLDDIDDCISKMHALRDTGVHFSMDDFGAGYSSLAYLTQLPLDQLKIDQSFIHNIGVKTTDAVIVQTIIGMAKNLGMEVIAEGVETEIQNAFLEQHGCPVYQGYLFSKPVPIEQFDLFLKQS